MTAKDKVLWMLRGGACTPMDFITSKWSDNKSIAVSYDKRITDLRREGFVIENDGEYFRLKAEPVKIKPEEHGQFGFAI